MAKQQKRTQDLIEIMAATAVTASGVGAAVAAPTPSSALMLVLDATSSASAVDDFLDVYVETSYAITLAGVSTLNWMGICRFTRLLGNGTDNLHYINVVGTGLGIGHELEIDAATPYALAQGEVVHMIGDLLRVRYVVTNGAGTHAYTFSVVGIPM